MKKTDFLNEIKGLSPEELKTRSVSIAEELMKLRFRQVTGQLEQTHRIRLLKRNLAQVQTIVAQKAAGIATPVVVKQAAPKSEKAAAAKEKAPAKKKTAASKKKEASA